MSDLYYVSSSPHIKSSKTVQSVMRDVIIALTPALLGAVLFFSFRALVIVAVSVSSCVLFEFLYNLIFKKPQSVSDLSAVVTGMLLGFNMPVTAPVYLPVIGAAFAIIVVKMLYGGLGKNIANPALCGRIFLFLSFSSYMTNWVDASTAINRTANSLPLFANTDVVYRHNRWVFGGNVGNTSDYRRTLSPVQKNNNMAHTCGISGNSGNYNLSVSAYGRYYTTSVYGLQSFQRRSYAGCYIYGNRLCHKSGNA